MDLSNYIDINSLPGEARKELKTFYDFLLFKYKRKKSGKQNKRTFNAIQLDTKNFKFNRDQANER